MERRQTQMSLIFLLFIRVYQRPVFELPGSYERTRGTFEDLYANVI